MKNLFCFALLLTLCFTFQIFDHSKGNPVISVINSLGCSDARVKIVNASITQCESFGINLSTECIKNYVLNQTNGQKWDVLAEIPDQSDARIFYWSYDDCAIKYEKFGQQKITYTIWKATASNSKSFGDKIKKVLVSQNKEESKQNQVCSDDRVKLAKDTINQCQNNDPSLELACIRNTIRGKSGQKWVALSSSQDKSQYSVRFYYFNGCIVQLNSFGTKKRNYLLWKAE